jgi:hypothetical protein
MAPQGTGDDLWKAIDMAFNGEPPGQVKQYHLLQQGFANNNDSPP